MKLLIPKKLVEILQKKKVTNAVVDENYNYYNYREHIEAESQFLEDKYIDELFVVAKEKIKDVDGANGLVQKLGMLISLRGKLSTTKIKRLDQLEHALTEYIRKDNIKFWLYRTTKDRFEPYLVTRIRYTPATKDSPADVTISLKYISMNNDGSNSITFYASDLREDYTVNDLLERKGYYHETDVLYANYQKSYEIYKKFIVMFGEQFWGNGYGYSADYRGEKYSLSKDKRRSRLVNDTDTEKSPSVVHTGTFWVFDNDSTLTIPIHPMIYMFDLEAHNHLWVHVDNLEIYKYNPQLKEKLILPANLKELIDILTVDIGHNLQDVVAGKTGGTIVITKGLPGTGKTLSAEVYSEVIERPLYIVQSSQLGISIKDLEDNLKKVLSNANKWRAVLLIDEADVYIHERGDDIHQNAIVGVFLRILEYYNGLMFMTTNRASIIDDAILSRATAIIEFPVPVNEDAIAITNTLATQFGLKFEKNVDKYISEKHPTITGRSIKNILKLAAKLAKGGNITKKHIDTASVYVYINGDNINDIKSIKK